MEEKIKGFFDEASKGHCDLELYKELLYSGANVLDYAVKNNRLNDFRLLVTPQKYDDGFVRILYDPFSDRVFNQLNMYSYQGTVGMKELIDSLYEIDYEKLFQIKIKDSHSRRISGMGHPIRGERDIILFSEPACLKSMLKLYELNIDTWANDTEGCIEDGNYFEEDGLKCGINIYYSRLDEENKKVVDRLIREGFVETYMDDTKDIIFLNVKCNKEETIGQVSDRLLAIVSQLKIQDVKSYQLSEEFIRKIVLDIYKSKYLVEYENLPYDILSSELIKYYEQFSSEELPEKDRIIQNLKNNLYSEESLNDYFHIEQEFGNQVLRNIAATTPEEKCIQELLESGYYIDEANNRIFSNKVEYLRHLKYLNSQQIESNANDNQMNQGDGYRRLSK